MRNQLLLLIITSTTWGCAFISEPDVGGSGQFDFFPEDPMTHESGAPQDGTDAGLLGPDSPARNCSQDEGPPCEVSDAGVDAASSASQSDAVPFAATQDRLPREPADPVFPIIPHEEEENDENEPDPGEVGNSETDDEGVEDEDCGDAAAESDDSSVTSDEHGDTLSPDVLADDER